MNFHSNFLTTIDYLITDTPYEMLLLNSTIYLKPWTIVYVRECGHSSLPLVVSTLNHYGNSQSCVRFFFH